MSGAEKLQKAMSELKAIQDKWREAENDRLYMNADLPRCKAEFLAIAREAYAQHRAPTDPLALGSSPDPDDDIEPIHWLWITPIAERMSWKEFDRIYNSHSSPLRKGYLSYNRTWHMVHDRDYHVHFEGKPIHVYDYVKQARRDYGKWIKKWRPVFIENNLDPELLPDAPVIEFRMIRSEGSEESDFERELTEAGINLRSDHSVSMEAVRETSDQSTTDAEIQPAGDGRLERWPPAEISHAYPEKAEEVYHAMTNRQRHVFALYFVNGFTMEAIADQTGTTKPRIIEMMARIDDLYRVRDLPLPKHSRPRAHFLGHVDIDTV